MLHLTFKYKLNLNMNWRCVASLCASNIIAIESFNPDAQTYDFCTTTFTRCTAIQFRIYYFLGLIVTKVVDNCVDGHKHVSLLRTRSSPTSQTYTCKNCIHAALATFRRQLFSSNDTRSLLLTHKGFIIQTSVCRSTPSPGEAMKRISVQSD